MNNTNYKAMEFTQLENDLITKCWDEPDKFAVNINPSTKAVSVVDLKTNRVIKHLGFANKLTEKLIIQSDIKPTYKEI